MSEQSKKVTVENTDDKINMVFVDNKLSETIIFQEDGTVLVVSENGQTIEV